MKLADGIAEIEGMLRCVDGLPSAISQTGEEYVEFRPGILPSGQGLAGFATTEDMIVDAFVAAVTEYAMNVAGPDNSDDLLNLTLYWRIRPEIEDSEDQVKVKVGRPPRPPRWVPRRVYRIYARLLVSGKPEIKRAAA